MTSRAATQSTVRTPSFSSSIQSFSRPWSSLPNAEEGRDTTEADAEREIVDEIDEIKRYEVSAGIASNHTTFC
jgi:hypothetical protein